MASIFAAQPFGGGPAKGTEAGSAESLVSRVKRRLFPPVTALVIAPQTVSLAEKRGINFQAGIAELLLVSRLRAKRKDDGKDVRERASHIVFVTCQNWFAEPEMQGGNRHTQHRTLL